MMSQNDRLERGLGGQLRDGTRVRGWVGRWRGAVPTGRSGVFARVSPADRCPRRGSVLVRFQRPPVEPCMRFSRTRLTDVLHRAAFGVARQGRFGLGAATHPLRLTRPSMFGDRCTTTFQP